MDTTIGICGRCNEPATGRVTSPHKTAVVKVCDKHRVQLCSMGWTVFHQQSAFDADKRAIKNQ